MGHNTPESMVCITLPLGFVVQFLAARDFITATPLTYRYKGRYESKANAVLKVFDSS